VTPNREQVELRKTSGSVDLKSSRKVQGLAAQAPSRSAAVVAACSWVSTGICARKIATPAIHAPPMMARWKKAPAARR